MDLAIAYLSDVGRVRSSNEDSVMCTTKPEAPHGYLLVVADGMGGAEAGEVASRMAVETLAEIYLSHKSGPPASLRRGIAEVNARIRFAGQEHSETHGMGTTCTALAVCRDRIFVTHVGDSRAYRVRAGMMERLTDDHSVWAEHVRSGDRHFSPAITSGRNQLTRALGIEPQVEADLIETDLRPGDRLVLCSDGLWNLVTDPEILRLAGSGTPEESCRRLVELANDRGSDDNVSVVVAEARE
jgi:PPM family protein phosphatase